MIDKNLQMSYLIVDEMHNDHPELLKDQYWNGIPNKLPDLGKVERKNSKEKVTFSDDQDFINYEFPKRKSSYFSRRNSRVSAISTFDDDNVYKARSDEEIGKPVDKVKPEVSILTILINLSFTVLKIFNLIQV